MDLCHPLAVVTPTLDGDVLTCLARADAAFTPGHLQRLIPDASVDGLRKVLNRLAAQGIVSTAGGGGRAVLYSLNREHLASAAILALADQGTALEARLANSIADWRLKPWYAALFGSWARGTAQGESDVDIFLVRTPENVEDVWDAQVLELERAVRAWTGNEGRCFTVDRADLASSGDDPVLRSIQDEGLTVYGRKSDFIAELRAAARARA